MNHKPLKKVSIKMTILANYLLKNTENNTIMKNLIILAFLVFTYLGYSQLIDPFGKIIVHEIKMNKQDNGTYIGAVEWTTGGIDSLQRYIVKGLDVKAPVLVRIISKAPDHNIDLSFHKSGWDKTESKISTDGDKFVDKIFRTMNTAGIGVRSKVAGIPYLIIVKVGLQFPSTKSLIRITDDKEEYAKHMRSIGYTGELFAGDDNSSMGNNSSTIMSSSGDNNTLMYIIIGLLAVIAILIAVFLLKRKSSKNTTLLFIIFCSAQFCMAQSSQPKWVPLDGQGESPVFYEYRTSNVANQNTVPVTTVMNVREVDIDVQANPGDVFLERRQMRIETNPGSRELTGSEAEEVQRRMREANEQFDEDYGEDSPGEETEGDQRTLPVDRDNEELDRLRRQVRRLQQQVDLLSQEDEEFEEDENEEAEIVIYCEQEEYCRTCMEKGFDDFATHYVYLQYLQDFYLSEINYITTQISYGNSLASVPGAGLGWGPILRNTIMPAVNELTRTYNTAFDGYIESMESDLETIRGCHTAEDALLPSVGGYEAQMYALINTLKASRINQ
jgi:hypothetical protein